MPANKPHLAEKFDVPSLPKLKSKDEPSSRKEILMARRSYQEGYVSKAKKGKRGEYFEIRYRVPIANGKWKHKSERLFGLAGKKEARQVLNDRLQRYSARNSQIGYLSVTDFIQRYWKPNLERRRTKPSTRYGYDCVLGKHIIPVIGDMPIIEIGPLSIEDVVSRATTSGLAPRSVRNVLVVLQSIFSLAAQDEVIPRSPVKKNHRPAVEPLEKPVWTAEDVRNILDAVPVPYQALFTLLALTGARIGEALALQWKHFDFERQTLRIQQSLWNGQLVAPKTKASIRTISFGDILAQSMTAHLGLSGRIGPDDFVFQKPDGSKFQPDVLRRDILYPVLDRMQFTRFKRGVGFHAFRHAAASLINQQTGNLKLAQNLLGHADISTTADVYTHISVESERSASVALENAIFGTDCSRVVRGN
jgi:integrase